MKKLNALLILNTKKIFIILIAWIFCILIHKLIFAIFGVEERILLLFATLIIPVYFIIALGYTVLAFLIWEKSILS